MTSSRRILTLMDYRQSRPWMEVILPLYTLTLLILYYHPQSLPRAIEEVLVDGMFRWVVWGIAGALGGILALSALFLAFCLVYSPIYLVENAMRILDPQAWVDEREVRFYAGCFVILCGLLALVFLNPHAALVIFTLLAGSAQFLWRFLV